MKYIIYPKNLIKNRKVVDIDIDKLAREFVKQNKGRGMLRREVLTFLTNCYPNCLIMETPKMFTDFIEKLEEKIKN